MDRHRLTHDDLTRVEEEFGDSGFYIFDEDLFRNNIRRFLAAFRGIYSNLVLGYSYKTNYTPYLCKVAREMGAYAEVVSFMEYCIAREIGYEGKHIIFNGPYKEYHDLEVAVDDGAIINVDNATEWKDLARIAENRTNAPLRIGVRCNFEISENRQSRFGMDVTDASFRELYQESLRKRQIEVRGVHCHFSTSTRSLESFVERASKITGIASDVFHASPLRYISIGGGFFGTIPESMKSHFSTAPPTFREYANAIATIFRERFPSEEMTLMLEPGAAIVADTFSYYCKVKDIKRVRNATYVIVNGGYHNVKPIGQGVNLPVEIISKGPSPVCPNVEIVGYTCMEFDRMHKTEMAAVGIGDYIRFSNVGAYTTVLKPPFIRESPPIIACKPGGGMTVIKRRETYKDILSTYVY